MRLQITRKWKGPLIPVGMCLPICRLVIETRAYRKSSKRLKVEVGPVLIEQVTIITKDVWIGFVHPLLYDGPPSANAHSPEQSGVFPKLAWNFRGQKHAHNPGADSFALIFRQLCSSERSGRVGFQDAAKRKSLILLDELNA